MVTTKSSTQHAISRLYFRRYADSPNREAITHSFGHGIYIGINTRKIMRVEFTGTAVTTLYTISYENSVMLIAKRSYFLQETFRCNLYTAHALYAFDNYCGYFVISKSLF